MLAKTRAEGVGGGGFHDSLGPLALTKITGTVIIEGVKQSFP